MTLRRDFIKIPGVIAAAAALSLIVLPTFPQQPVTLLNVSYDPMRELSVAFNQAFAKHWKATGQDVTIKQSHTAARASRPARRSTGSKPLW